TAERLQARVRRALDVRAKIRENPVVVGGLAAGALFLAVGGPVRLLRAARGRIPPTRVEQAYDTLPKALQRWVETASGACGTRAGRHEETPRDDVGTRASRWARPRRDRVGRWRIDAGRGRLLLDRWILGYRLVLLVLVVAVWDMIFKPGL